MTGQKIFFYRTKMGNNNINIFKEKYVNLLNLAMVQEFALNLTIK